MHDLHPTFRLWIYSDNRAGVFGDGKARRLQTVAQTDSLREAVPSLGMRYRKAWEDLKKAEACRERRPIERMRGGKGGGYTTRTDDGLHILSAYEGFRQQAQEHMEHEFHNMLHAIDA